MEAIVVVITIIAALVAFDIAALRWGADTRPSLGDHRRR